MLKRAFTIVELLVVIAVIALLVAVLVPTLLAAKNRARSAICTSNMRQLSIGLVVYEAEQEVFPYGFNDKAHKLLSPPLSGFLGSGPDKVGWWWVNYLQSILEISLDQDSVTWCPARKAVGPGTRNNLLCGNYGVNRSICVDAQGTLGNPFVGEPLGAKNIRFPARTLLIGDSGYSLLSWRQAAIPDEVELSSSSDHPYRINSFFIPGLEMNQDRPGLADNPDATDGRHSRRTINFGYADGHTEQRKAEALAIEPAVLESGAIPLLWMP